jgi:hypothetical protein
VGHVLQKLEPLSAYLPGAQLVHSNAPAAFVNCPALHKSHTKPDANLPLGQLAHPSEFAAENLPEVHAEHAVEKSGAYWPAMQVLQGC